MKSYIYIYIYIYYMIVSQVSQQQTQGQHQAQRIATCWLMPKQSPHASSHQRFSSRTWASSSGVKSFTMLNCFRISSVVLPCSQTKWLLTKGSHRDERVEGGPEGVSSDKYMSRVRGHSLEKVINSDHKRRFPGRGVPYRRGELLSSSRG